jgi:hypothetical protein
VTSVDISELLISIGRIPKLSDLSESVSHYFC